jgi:hypothetical protein
MRIVRIRMRTRDPVCFEALECDRRG